MTDTPVSYCFVEGSAAMLHLPDTISLYQMPFVVGFQTIF
jgi:hypothetical protein